MILGIESSCDDTSAAVLCGTEMLSNVIASQAVHMQYGGVIPELASRAHQQNIVPVVDTALKNASVGVSDLDAIAFTRGPGLLGSLDGFTRRFAVPIEKYGNKGAAARLKKSLYFRNRHYTGNTVRDKDLLSFSQLCFRK